MLNKVYTSYFYQIRFFKPYMVPLSTAVWDPKWFHNFNGQETTFIDKNGVLNGCRFEAIHPDETCVDLCRGRENCQSKNPSQCQFLVNYGKQLNSLDFNLLIKNLETFLDTVKSGLSLKERAIPIFIVHEAVDNPCSERIVIQRWFNENGIYCKELPYPLSQNYDKIF